MTRDDIIRIAKEVGLPTWYQDNALANESLILKFANLVTAAEREACAKFIEQDYVRQFDEPWQDNLSKAIRARGQV